ncbi:SDR family oxidoreductase [Lichenicoccus sp.]|uniref:SDR family oxidoreductase n=1 Tax=Lichenicoccus sp. TaxID=2781899 RepID=UPI003D0B14DA
MNVKDKIVLVTGAAQGIGQALCVRFQAEGARRVIVSDRNASGAEAVARQIGGLAIPCDVTQADEVAAMVAKVHAEIGSIDLYCSNAGIIEPDPDFHNAASASEASWARSWAVNVMGHVYAARAVLPSMIARRQGGILNTVSAAGLLSQIGSATYSTTKHAALGFTEHLAIAHRDDNIHVAALCPQGVDTAMTRGASAKEPALLDGLLSPEAVADSVITGLAERHFLILPHPQVLSYVRHKAADTDRWIGGMAKLRRNSKG